MRRYKQSKPNGAYDVNKLVVKGFGGEVGRQSSGMTIGWDGRLYLTAGDGDNLLKGSDGRPATVLRSGAVFRCRPDGSKLETFAIGFVNPHGAAAFDAAGNLFAADGGATSGEFAEGRLMHVLEGADFGWRLKAGARCCEADPVRAGDFNELHGKFPPMLRTDRGAAAGLLIYTDTRFPENYRGLLLRPDATSGRLRSYKVDRKEGVFAVVEAFDLLKSDDPLFRPRQAVAGPDGAIYVVDERSLRDKPRGDGQHGRIYRLTWAGTKDQPALPPRDRDAAAKIAKLDDDGLMKALTAGEDGDAPRLELMRRGEKERPALLKLLNDAQQPDAVRIVALSALRRCGTAMCKRPSSVCLSWTAPPTCAGAQALGLKAAKADEDVQNALLRATDSASEVRRSAALAMSHVAAPGAADVLVNTWSFDDGRNVALRDGLVHAIENLGRLGVSRLVALGESGVQKETDKVVEAFTMFRTRAGADGFHIYCRIRT